MTLPIIILGNLGNVESGVKVSFILLRALMTLVILVVRLIPCSRLAMCA